MKGNHKIRITRYSTPWQRQWKITSVEAANSEKVKDSVMVVLNKVTKYQYLFEEQTAALPGRFLAIQVQTGDTDDWLKFLNMYLPHEREPRRRFVHDVASIGFNWEDVVNG